MKASWKIPLLVAKNKKNSAQKNLVLQGFLKFVKKILKNCKKDVDKK